MIFDAHVHLMTLIDRNRIDETELTLLLERMRVCGVDRALLLGAVAISQFPTEQQIRDVNDQTMTAVSCYPERFSGLCYLNPEHDPGFIRAEMDRCISQGPLAGVKLWVALNARDPRHDPLLEYCAELDCPLLYHAWHKTVQRNQRESDPTDIAHLARRHRTVRLIMAHMMGCGVRGMSDVADCPNVHVDFSGSPPIAGVFEYALEALGPQRIVYGSDWPIRDLATQLGKLEAQNLSPEVRQAILGDNLRRILGRRSPC